MEICAVHDTTPQAAKFELKLPQSWPTSLPVADHKWVLKALFVAKKGRPVLGPAIKLWWYPPQTPFVYHQPPASADGYFSRPLFLWMPYRMWSVRLGCLQPGCDGYRLTACGLYKLVRQVLDIDGYYSMASEYLECGRCKKKYISWSNAILKQLDVGHRSLFPAILTYRYACDLKVLRLMRERGLGNSVHQLQKKLREQHSEVWLQRVLHYLTDCEPFVGSLIARPTFSDPPSQPVLPKPRWLMTIYATDVLLRLDEVKASITSVYGSVLKMDSTKKIVKKLAGASAGTASWATNVGNEFGQILTCVLTSQEGVGVAQMAGGIVSRYAAAGVAPPTLLYVDRDCCTVYGECQAKTMFAWETLQVRLDIWHLMRRFALGCTSDAHQLYGVFMNRLSACIFEWDAGDLASLQQAKRRELELQHVTNPSQLDVAKRIGRRELSLHCRRRTRGVEETTTMIESLLRTLDGHQGLDTMGIPLLDHQKIWAIWEIQRHHMPCIQDPEGIQLYTETGTLVKGGVELKTYRCARGSNSLENFHLHMNRFIPGTQASDMHFQAYILEGIVRWNQDRSGAAAVGGVPEARSFNGLMKQSAHQLSLKVLGKSLLTHFKPPAVYTGEKLGVEYLYAQTGQILEDVPLDTEEVDVDSADEDDEDDQLDEGFQDMQDVANEDQTIGNLADVLPDLLGQPEASGSVQGVREETPKSPGPSTPNQTDTEDDEDTETVGPDNIRGYDRVQALAGLLVSLRNRTSLSKKLVDQIITLWQALDEFDKRRIPYSPRYKKRLTEGGFKAAKSNVAPGVDSLKRCMVGEGAGPAQRPNCCRLVECICIQLCDLNPSPVKTSPKSGRRTTPRWTLVARAYKLIRSLVVDNAAVMESTAIQLPEINSTTLTHWYRKRQRSQERNILLQAVELPAAMSVAPVPLPAPRPLLPALPKYHHAEHTYVTPPNTAGQATHGRRRAPAPMPTYEVAGDQQVFVVSAEELQHGITLPEPLPGSSQAGEPPTPRSTAYRHKRRLDLGVEPKYQRKKQFNHCKACGEPRTLDTGHSQFRGKLFCPKNEAGQTKEQFLEEMRAASKAK